MTPHNVLEVLDPSGHLTLTWDPDDPESVARAGAEFDRLKAAGYAFFATTEDDAVGIKRLTRKTLTEHRTLDVRVVDRAGEPAQTRTFNNRAARTVAVPPMRGG